MKRYILPLITFIILTTPYIGKTQITNDTTQVNKLNIDSLDMPNTYTINILARSYGDSIVLRWAVSNPGIWMLSNGYGWQISTFKSTCDTCGYTEYIGGDTIRAMSLEEMKANFSENNLIAGTAAQALYGHSVFPTQQGKDQELMDYIFRRNQEQTQRQFLAYFAAEQDAQVASALGLRAVDKNVKRGESYEYTIKSFIPEELALIYNSTILVNNEPFVRTEEDLIPKIEINQIDPYRVIIACKKNRLSGYFFERSSDGGKTWDTLNEAPIYPLTPDHETRAVYGDYIADLMETHVTFMDSLELKKSYIYRAKAFDAFADYAPERKSEPFEMIDLIPPTAPVLLTIFPEENKKCALKWVKDEIEEDFNNFIVTFSESSEGPWQDVSGILDKNVRDYIDTNAQERGRGYYRIFCNDIYGNISFSNIIFNYIEDIKPPKMPQNLWAEVDTLGRMELHWDKNKEKDLLGYKVYAANQRDHDYVEVSNGYLYTNEFIDTVDIHSLTSHLFCYVVAFDNSHNYSLSSDTLEVKFPDFIAPGAVLLEDYTLNEGTLTARWRRSISDDVAYYFIYRKPENQTRWECIYIATPEYVNKEELLIINDNPAPSEITYQYAAEAVDEAKNSSGLTGQFSVHITGPSIIDVDIKLTATKDKKNSTITLNWDYLYKSDYEHYGVIYRSVNGGEYQDIHAFESGIKTYQDNKVNEGDNVRYYIQLMLGRGKRSTPSPEVNVKL